MLTATDCVQTCKCRNGDLLLCEQPVNEGLVQLFCEGMGDADPDCSCC